MRHKLFSPLIVFSLLCGPSFAQEDLSVEELTELFQRQKDAFSEANNNGLGKTRGLKLVTVEGAAAAESAATVTAEANPVPTDPNAPIAATPVVFGQLDAELQVNVAVVMGEIKGRIEAKERIEVYPPGRVLGDIQSPVISIEPGGVFNGGCVMKVSAESAGKATVFSNKPPADSEAGSKPLSAEPKKKIAFTELKNN